MSDVAPAAQSPSNQALREFLTTLCPLEESIAFY
jgi:hypothetical protein